MKSYVQIEGLTKSYGDRLLFGDVTLGVYEGDKIGIIAKNGAGKTTFLRCVAGLEQYDSGTVTFRNGLKVAMLEQQPSFVSVQLISQRWQPTQRSGLTTSRPCGNAQTLTLSSASAEAVTPRVESIVEDIVTPTRLLPESLRN